MIDRQYKSFEEKRLPLLKDFAKGIWSSWKGFYTLPTTARKFMSGQNVTQRYIDNGEWSKTVALALGMGVGAYFDITDVNGFSFSDWPLYLWLATNAASGIYEAKNMDKTRQNIARLVSEEQ